MRLVRVVGVVAYPRPVDRHAATLASACARPAWVWMSSRDETPVRTPFVSTRAIRPFGEATDSLSAASRESSSWGGVRGSRRPSPPSAAACAPRRGRGSSCRPRGRALRDLGEGRQREQLEAAFGAEEVGDEVVGRAGEEFGGGRALDEVGAGAEDRDAVAEPYGLVDVVRDEDDGLVQLLLQAQEFVLELGAHHRVHRAEGLVHQQYRRVGGERAGHADALLLAAGELVRVALPCVGGEADGLQEFGGAGAGLLPAVAQQERHGGDVVEDRAVREEARLLDDVADGAAQFGRVLPGDVLAADLDDARGRVDHPVDHPKGGRLAATGGSDQYGDPALRHLQGEVVNCCRAVGEAFVDRVELDHELSLARLYNVMQSSRCLNSLSMSPR